MAIVAWTRRYPAVTGAIVGTRSAAQVDGIMSGAFDLDPAEIADIEAGPDWEEGTEHWLYPPTG